MIAYPQNNVEAINLNSNVRQINKPIIKNKDTSHNITGQSIQNLFERKFGQKKIWENIYHTVYQRITTSYIRYSICNKCERICLQMDKAKTSQKITMLLLQEILKHNTPLRRQQKSKKIVNFFQKRYHKLNQTN